jgi:hypothetical protein
MEITVLSLHSNYQFNIHMKKLLLSAIASFAFVWAGAQTIQITPLELEATVNQGETAVVYTVIANTGADTLDITFPGWASRGSGGPDDFGYLWVDSDDPNGPEYEWIEISETGYEIEGLGDDNVAGPFPIGFEFPFYGQGKNHFWINSNGVVGFDDQLIQFANQPIPTNSNYVDFVAWFWDDLMIDTAFTHTYYKNFDNKVVIQFEKYVHFPGTEQWITAEVILQNGGDIIIRYKQVREGFATDNGTIGIQSYNPEMGLQVNYNAPYVHSEMALRFDSPSQTTGFITGVAPANFSLPPGTQEHVWITYDSEGYEVGTYQQELLCVSNDTVYPEVVIHNTMVVTSPVSEFFLVGRVWAGYNAVAGGFAYGYKMTEDGTVVDIYAEMTGEQGYYEFSGLSSAWYIVKAEPSPSSPFYGAYLPTYYGDVLHWEDATVIHLTQNTDGAQIHLVPATTMPSGTGSISGSIQNSGDQANASDIPVILKIASSGGAVITYSDAAGNFTFDNLGYGTYEVFAEIPGKSITPGSVTLDATTPSVSGVDMLITGEQIVFLGIEEDFIYSMTLPYPNPATGQVNLIISPKKPAILNIEVSDVSGRIIKLAKQQIETAGTVSIDLSGIPSGYYLIRISDESGSQAVRSFIKE